MSSTSPAPSRRRNGALVIGVVGAMPAEGPADCGGADAAGFDASRTAGASGCTGGRAASGDGSLPGASVTCQGKSMLNPGGPD